MRKKIVFRWVKLILLVYCVIGIAWYYGQDSLVLHPVAMVLMWINLIARGDMTGFVKIVWFVVSLIWGLGPILYVLVTEGALW